MPYKAVNGTPTSGMSMSKVASPTPTTAAVIRPA